MKQDKAAQEAIIGGFNNLRQVFVCFSCFVISPPFGCFVVSLFFVSCFSFVSSAWGKFSLGILEGLYFVKIMVLIYKLAGPH